MPSLHSIFNRANQLSKFFTLEQKNLQPLHQAVSSMQKRMNHATSQLKNHLSTSLPLSPKLRKVWIVPLAITSIATTALAAYFAHKHFSYHDATEIPSPDLLSGNRSNLNNNVVQPPKILTDWTSTPSPTQQIDRQPQTIADLPTPIHPRVLILNNETSNLLTEPPASDSPEVKEFKKAVVTDLQAQCLAFQTNSTITTVNKINNFTPPLMLKDLFPETGNLTTMTVQTFVDPTLGCNEKASPSPSDHIITNQSTFNTGSTKPHFNNNLQQDSSTSLYRFRELVSTQSVIVGGAILVGLAALRCLCQTHRKCSRTDKKEIPDPIKRTPLLIKMEGIDQEEQNPLPDVNGYLLPKLLSQHIKELWEFQPENINQSRRHARLKSNLATQLFGEGPISVHIPTPLLPAIGSTALVMPAPPSRSATPSSPHSSRFSTPSGSPHSSDEEATQSEPDLESNNEWNSESP